MINNTQTIPKVINEFVSDSAAKLISNKIGAPKATAGTCCNTKLLAAGVSKLGSISLSKIKPVEAVPVSIPNIEKNPSYSYPG